MWLELIWWIYNVLIFHQHILLIACEPLLNLMVNYLICVAGKQWETLRFTIEVSTCMVHCLIAHYCAITGTILIFRFLTIWSCTWRSCCQRFWPIVRPFFIWGNELSMNISQVKKLGKIVRINKLATKNNKIFDNPKVYGVATVFEGRVFNPNLLIRHKGSQRIFSSISSWVVNSTTPG